MYILRQTNLLKFGLITIGIIIALFCFYVIVGFLGIQYIMEPYKYGTFFAWVIILFGIFYRFTFLLLTIGVFFWHYKRTRVASDICYFIHFTKSSFHFS